MKKFLNIFLSLLMSVTLLACQKEDTPSSKVRFLLNNYKKQNWSEVNSCFDESDIFNYEDSKESNDIETELLSIMCDIDYTIIDEVIVDANHATVNVKIKAMNLGDQVIVGIQNAIMLMYNNPDTSDEEYFEAIIGPTKECTKTFEETVEVSLTKVNEDWIVDSSNYTLLNAMTGGFMNVMNNLS